MQILREKFFDGPLCAIGAFEGQLSPKNPICHYFGMFGVVQIMGKLVCLVYEWHHASHDSTRTLMYDIGLSPAERPGGGGKYKLWG